MGSLHIWLYLGGSKLYFFREYTEQNTMASLNLQNCINIPDDYEGYRTSLFCIPNHYSDAVGSVLIPHGMIQDRIEKLGRDVFYDMLSCDREPLHALCVLKGGYKFFADMLDKVNSLNKPLGGLSPGVGGLHQGQVLRERPVHGRN